LRHEVVKEDDDEDLTAGRTGSQSAGTAAGATTPLEPTDDDRNVRRGDGDRVGGAGARPGDTSGRAGGNSRRQRYD
jgi:hypothetical protein